MHCMREWIEAWLQQFIIATTRRNWFRDEKSCYANVQVCVCVCVSGGGGGGGSRNNHWGETTRCETSSGQTEISGRNGLGRNNSDFRRQGSNVFYPLQNQFKATALIDTKCISLTLMCDYSNCQISFMYLGAWPMHKYLITAAMVSSLIGVVRRLVNLKLRINSKSAWRRL